MSNWSLMMTRWMSGAVAAREVKLSGPMKWTDHLRNQCTFDTVIEPGQPWFSRPMESDHWARVFWPMKDGTPYGAFAFTGHGWDSDSDGIKVYGVRVDDILARRFIRHDLQFQQVDQNDIVRDLIDYGNGWATSYTLGGWVGPDYGQWQRIPWWTLGQRKSGVLRDRLIVPGNEGDGYQGVLRKNVAEQIRLITELGGDPGAPELPGPEIKRSAYWDAANDRPAFLFDIGYPRVGTVDPPILLDHPSGNVTKASFAADSTGRATFVEVGGQTVDGQPRNFGAQLDPGGIDSGVPFMERFWSESSVSNQGTLNAKAWGRLVESRTNTGYSLTLDGAKYPQFGLDYHVGDNALLRLTQAGVRQPDALQRILGWTATVSGQSEQVQLELGAA